jgi:hypothetical protein
MTVRHPIEAAEEIFRSLGGFAPGTSEIPAPASLFAAVEAFAPVAFEVSEHLPEQDVFFFQYAATTHLWEGVGFVVGFVRQFEVVDADDEHLGFVQLQAEYRFPPDPELDGLGHHEDYWFRSGSQPFEEWFARVTTDPVWRLVAAKPAANFEIWQEWV